MPQAFDVFLTELGANPDAVSYLVGHDLGLRGVYTDVRALKLRAAVAKLPDFRIPPPEPTVIDGPFKMTCGENAGFALTQETQK